MQLTRKVTRLNGTLREYEHPRHGKLSALSYIGSVVLVWTEAGFTGTGWAYPGSAEAKERRLAEIERLTGVTPKKRRRKNAGAEPASPPTPARRTG